MCLFPVVFLLLWRIKMNITVLFVALRVAVKMSQRNVCRSGRNEEEKEIAWYETVLRVVCRIKLITARVETDRRASDAPSNA